MQNSSGPSVPHVDVAEIFFPENSKKKQVEISDFGRALSKTSTPFLESQIQRRSEIMGLNFQGEFARVYIK